MNEVNGTFKSTKCWILASSLVLMELCLPTLSEVLAMEKATQLHQGRDLLENIFSKYVAGVPELQRHVKEF